MAMWKWLQRDCKSLFGLLSKWSVDDCSLCYIITGLQILHKKWSLHLHVSDWSYNSLICTHLIPQMCNVFKPQLMSSCDLHSNVNHSFLKLVKGCKLKQMWDLPQFGLRETLKSCLHIFLKAIQNDCLCIFTLNGKVRILWVMTQIWKTLFQIIFISYVHLLSFHMAGEASCAPQRAHKCTLPGLWSELALGHRGCLLHPHQMTFTATCPSLLDLHIIRHSMQ